MSMSFLGIRNLNDVAFVIDTSSDVSKKELSDVIYFIKSFSTSYKFNGETFVSIVNYGRQTQIPLLLKGGGSYRVVDYTLDFISAIGGRRNMGSMFTALTNDVFTNQNGARSKAVKTAILFVHGNNVAGIDKSTLKQIKDKGINVIVVAIGEDVNKGDIEDIVDDKADAIYIGKTSDLPTAFTKLEDALSNTDGNCFLLKLCFKWLVNVNI